jgi:hypothetical protein
MLVKVFANKKAHGLKEFTHILLEIVPTDRKQKPAFFSVQGDGDIGCEKLLHVQM